MFIDNFLTSPGAEYAGGILDHFAGGIDSNFRFLRRPFLDERGRACVTVNTGRYTTEKGERVPIRERRLVNDLRNAGYVLPPVTNATSLRKEEWIELDRVALQAARQRLRAWKDLAAANTFGGFNGMSKMTLEYEAMSDPGEAIIDMDAITAGRNDSPLFKLRSLPLPITHSDYWFSSRRLAVSRNTGTPLDTTMGEAAARRVAEMIEKTTIGVETGLTYGTVSSGPTAHDGASTVYGYTNYVNRLTKTDLTTPTGANPNATVADVLDMRNSLYDNKFYGPFMLYHSTDWDQYMDNDYAFTNSTGWASDPSRTLRERLKSIEGIQDVQRLDFLDATDNPFTLLMVQMTADVARAVIGMDITTVQWESSGGMQLNFKVMAIMVPQLRSDYSGNCGILQATTS